jgi:glucose-6-phosphate dehydrogenase assembly protein OpcA
VRLRPWRELLAGLFEGPFRPFVDGVHHAEVTGKNGPRHLLAGWITDRLGLHTSQVDVVESVHVNLRLAARDDAGREATFEVLRPSDERHVVARAAIRGGATSEAIVRLPPSTPGWGVAEALSSLSRDPVYESALAMVHV